MLILNRILTLSCRWLAFALLLMPAGAAAQGVVDTLHDAVLRSGGRVMVILRSSNAGAALRELGAPPVPAAELESITERLATRFQLRERSRAVSFGMVMGDIDPNQVDALLSDSNVVAVEADRLWAPTDLGDGFDPSDRWAAYRRHERTDDIPYGVTQVTAPTVWAAGNHGEGVKVAVLDSGGDPTHPDLAYAGGYNAITQTASGWTDDVAVCTGHGTHVAGTIAALDNGSGVVGVAPRVQLYAIKVFQDLGGSCLAYTSSQITGLNWAVTQGIRLVNVSIGGSFSVFYDDAIRTAATQGTYVVAAAGNDGGALTFPGSSQYAIGVAAVNAGNSRASWSNFGPQLDFSAPGVSINSTMPGGGYGTKSGTSMATPHVVGVSALIFSAFPSLTFDQLYQKLRDGALDLESVGFDNNTGYGLVRAANSIGGPPPLVLAVSPTSRRATVQQGTAAPGDNASVTLSGTGASTAAWSATKRKAWTTLTTASGIGSGTVTWTRNATGLAVGTWVDTLTVTATGAIGSPTVVYDTLIITAAPPPLVLAVSPTSRRATVQQGTAAPGDNASVTLSGTGASTAAWSATKRKAWTTLTTASGIGSGTVTWTRNATGLAVGTWVDTLTVTATGAIGSPTVVYDTLIITAAPPPLVLAVSPTSRRATVQQGTAAPGDNASVTLSGTGASTAAWSATKRKAWTTLTTASGTGSGTVTWTRNATGLAVGTWVDTLTVTATGAIGSPTVVYDTLIITAAPPPLVLAVSPTSRRATVQQGTAAPGDNASVTLSGTGASTAAWSATKRKAWTTLTTASGTGSGTVTWTRNATGLAVGTWVDTLTVTATGAIGSPTMVFDTLIITAAPPPLVLAVSPTSRRATVQQGTAAPGDNASVTLSGTGASTAAWSATKRKAWTTLTTASGIGSGTVTWTRNATGLAVGTWVDTLTVTATGAIGSPTVVYDTLIITAAPPPLVLAVSPTSRRATVQQGTAAPGDNASVTLSGTGASTAAWSATKRKAWTTLTTASGTGSGTVTWTRNATGLAVGTWVDTLTVTATGAIGSPTVVYDTLIITAAPPPLVLAVSPTSRRATVQQGTAAPGDNASVTLSGTGASTAAWSATKRKAWTTLTTASGTGSGTVTWTRNATGLAVGTWVDTLTVTATGAIGSPTVVYDTLIITAAPPPLVLAVSPTSRRATVQQGTAAPGDNASVTLSGTGASTAAWSATKRKAWTTLTTASGTGSGTVTWTRNATGLAVGTWVDTLTVTATGAIGSPTMVFDTLIITAAPPPLVLAVSPTSRRATVQQGTAAPGDNASVTLSGTGASTAAWSATKRKAWTTLTTASGTGSGTVTWTRNATGLAVGTWVDTLTVTATGAIGSPTVVYDTLIITAAPPPLVLAVSPTSRRATVQQGTAAPGDNASVTLSGTGASTAAWSATKRKAWTTLTTASGTGSGTVTWTRNATGLAVGTWVDTLTVTATGAIGSPTMVFDTLIITAAPPPLVLAVSPTSRRATVQQGTAAPGDNASVTLSGTGASTAAWSATKRKAWTTLTTASGTGSGTVTWTRNATGLAVGTWVDTLTVTATGAIGSPTVVYDTIRVTAIPVSVNVAVTPGSRSAVVVQGSSAPSDAAAVTLAGDNAANTAWIATNRQSWTVLTSSSGTGSGTVTWTRNATGLAVGTWVDTLTVTVPSSGSVAWVIDTLQVEPVASVATNPRGRRHRVLVSSGSARILGPISDSARVEGQVADGASDLWAASVTSSSLQLVTTSGHLSDWIHWQRVPSQVGAGLYIDTMHITLQAAPAVATILVDTLEVVNVAAPAPSAGVDELFRPGTISDDQRAVLDRDGNNNGRYDLGDFLAWVDRDQIRLSPAMVSRLMQLVVPDRAAAPRTAVPTRARMQGGS